jgi:hypothetical protein
VAAFLPRVLEPVAGVAQHKRAVRVGECHRRRRCRAAGRDATGHPALRAKGGYWSVSRPT